MNLYLGLIKYRPNTQWCEVYKLIKAETKEIAEAKLKKWSDENLSLVENKLIIVTETL